VTSTTTNYSTSSMYDNVSMWYYYYHIYDIQVGLSRLAIVVNNCKLSQLAKEAFICCLLSLKDSHKYYDIKYSYMT
jgi:hypothetical protein